MIKVISFDLDGTLTDSNFDRLVWYVELPRIYAKQKNISEQEALKLFGEEYDNPPKNMGGEWADIDFWFKKYNIDSSWEEVLSLLRKEIKHYPETIKVLEELQKKNFKLIVITSAERKFLTEKLKLEKIDKYFYKTYSAPSDFNKPTKDKEVFRKVLKELNIRPEEMIHVGDDIIKDVEIPKSLGIKSLLINRKESTKDSIKTLNELKRFL